MNFKELVESVLISEVALSSANKIRFMKRFNTDSDKALEYLERFNKAVLKLANKDIFSYKSLEELDKALEGIKVIKTKGEVKREAAVMGSKIVYEDSNYVLRLIRSKQAAIAYGKGANWCISYDDSKRNEDEPRTGNMFWKYSLVDGNTVYIAVAKGQLDENTGEELKKISILIDDRGDCEIWTADNTRVYGGPQIAPVPEVESVYPNVQRIVKHIPYTDEELKPYINESVTVGLYYAFRTGNRVPEVEKHLLASCSRQNPPHHPRAPTASFSKTIIEYATEVVGKRWPEYEDKLLARLKHIIDNKSYYASTFLQYNNDEPFIQYIKILQNTNEEWPEFEELLESLSGDIMFKRLYHVYRNMVQGRTMNSQTSSYYYEDRGV